MVKKSDLDSALNTIRQTYTPPIDVATQLQTNEIKQLIEEVISKLTIINPQVNYLGEIDKKIDQLLIMTCYVVRNGRRNGIFLSWDFTKQQISGFPGNDHSRFSDLYAAWVNINSYRNDFEIDEGIKSSKQFHNLMRILQSEQIPEKRKTFLQALADAPTSLSEVSKQSFLEFGY